MPTYIGSCHCGAVRFEVCGDLTTVGECNCSICSRKGALHWRVAGDAFTLLRGRDDLQMYRFGTKTAKHFFCRHCGIHPFSHPRFDPTMVSVNVRCLEGVALDTLERRRFDGKNWEDAAKQHGWKPPER